MSDGDERETIIRWAAGDEGMSVYSCEPRIWRLCERMKGTLKREGKCARTGKTTWRDYDVSFQSAKPLVGRRKGRKLTEVERKQKADVLRKARPSSRRQSFGHETATPDGSEARLPDGAVHDAVRGL